VCDFAVVQSLAVQDDFESQRHDRHFPADGVIIEQQQQSKKLVSNLCAPSSF